MTALPTDFRKSNQLLPIKRYILLFANNFIRLSVQLAVIFLYARSLPVADYGRYQTVWLYVNVLSVLTLFGLPNLVLTYGSANITQWIKSNKRESVLYIFLFIATLLLVLLQRLNLTLQTKALLLIFVCVQNLAIIVEHLSIKRGTDTKVVVVNMIVAVLFLTCHIAILKTGYSLPLLLICLCAIQVVKFLLLFKFNTVDQSDPIVKNLGKQWFYLGLVDSLSVIYRWLDKWIILVFISVSQFALYFNGSYEIPIFMLLVSAVGNVLLVELSKENTYDVKRIKQLFTNTSLLLAAVVFPAFSFLFFYNQLFFLLFFGEKYAEAIPIFLISIFIIPLRITSFTVLLQSRHRNDLVLRGVIVDIASAILFMLLLYPWLGIRGIALAFVLSTYLQAIFYLRKTLVVTKFALSDIFPLKQLFFLLSVSFLSTGIAFFLFGTYLPEYKLLAGVFACFMLSLILLYGRKGNWFRIL